jgi:4-amino-4-deoxy-L-arabinose transferase-like glycosyltransferase
MAAVGAVLGLLAITKLSALPVIIVVIPLVPLRRGWISRIKLVGAAILPILLIAGWYFVQNQVRYGRANRSRPLHRATTSRPSAAWARSGPTSCTTR